MMQIALVTYSEAPQLWPDDRLVIAPLRALGIEAVPVVWDAPYLEWASFRAALIRETWDYFVRPREFAAWLERTSKIVAIHNAPSIVRWNTHKRYLVELAERGLPVTPTHLCRGESLTEIAKSRNWDRVVVKPAISGGARLTRRFDRSAYEGEGQAHLELVIAEGDALVQPYLPALDREGERSYVFFGGVMSHAVQRAATMGAKGGPPDGAAIAPVPEEVALAERVLAAIPGATLYARVDLASGDEGPLLQEVELIEPRLFLGASPGAPLRFAEAIARVV